VRNDLEESAIVKLSGFIQSCEYGIGMAAKFCFRDSLGFLILVFCLLVVDSCRLGHRSWCGLEFRTAGLCGRFLGCVHCDDRTLVFLISRLLQVSNDAQKTFI